MPTMVKGGDGRVLAENLADSDAHALAQRVHAATGELVTLIPYMFAKGKYVLDEAASRVVGAVEEVVEEVKAEAKKAAAKKAPAKAEAKK